MLSRPAAAFAAAVTPPSGVALPSPRQLHDSAPLHLHLSVGREYDEAMLVGSSHEVHHLFARAAPAAPMELDPQRQRCLPASLTATTIGNASSESTHHGRNSTHASSPPSRYWNRQSSWGAPPSRGPAANAATSTTLRCRSSTASSFCSRRWRRLLRGVARTRAYRSAQDLRPLARTIAGSTIETWPIKVVPRLRP